MNREEKLALARKRLNKFQNKKSSSSQSCLDGIDGGEQAVDSAAQQSTTSLYEDAADDVMGQDDSTQSENKSSPQQSTESVMAQDLDIGQEQPPASFEANISPSEPSPPTLEYVPPPSYSRRNSSQLLDRIQLLEAENSKLKKDVDAQSQEIIDLQTQLRTSKDGHANLSEQVSKLQQELHTTNDQLKQSKAVEQEEWKERYQALEEELQIVKLKNEEYEEQLNQKQLSLSGSLSEVEDLKASNDVLNQKHNEMQDQQELQKKLEVEIARKDLVFKDLLKLLDFDQEGDFDSDSLLNKVHELYEDSKRLKDQSAEVEQALYDRDLQIESCQKLKSENDKLHEEMQSLRSDHEAEVSSQLVQIKKLEEKLVDYDKVKDASESTAEKLRLIIPVYKQFQLFISQISGKDGINDANEDEVLNEENISERLVSLLGQFEGDQAQIIRQKVQSYDQLLSEKQALECTVGEQESLLQEVKADFEQIQNNHQMLTEYLEIQSGDGVDGENVKLDFPLGKKLNEFVNRLKIEVTQSLDQVAELACENQVLKDQSRHLSDLLSQKEHDLDISKQDVQQKLAIIADLEYDLDSVRSQKVISVDSYEEAQDQLRQTKATLTQVENNFRLLNDRAIQLEVQFDQSRDLLLQYATAIKSFCHEHEEFETILNGVIGDKDGQLNAPEWLDCLNKIFGKLPDSTLSSTALSLRQELKELSAELDSKVTLDNNNKAGNGDALQQLESDLKSTQSRCKDLEIALSEAQDSFDEQLKFRDQCIADLESQLSKLYSQKSSPILSNDSQAQIQQLEQQLQELKLAHGTKNLHISQLESQVSELKSEIAVKAQQIKEMREQLRVSETRVTAMQKQQVEMQSRIQPLQKIENHVEYSQNADDQILSSLDGNEVDYQDGDQKKFYDMFSQTGETLSAIDQLVKLTRSAQLKQNNTEVAQNITVSSDNTEYRILQEEVKQLRRALMEITKVQSEADDNMDAAQILLHAQVDQLRRVWEHEMEANGILKGILIELRQKFLEQSSPIAVQSSQQILGRSENSMQQLSPTADENDGEIMMVDKLMKRIDQLELTMTEDRVPLSAISGQTSDIPPQDYARLKKAVRKRDKVIEELKLEYERVMMEKLAFERQLKDVIGKLKQQSAQFELVQQDMSTERQQLVASFKDKLNELEAVNRKQTEIITRLREERDQHRALSSVNRMSSSSSVENGVSKQLAAELSALKEQQRQLAECIRNNLSASEYGRLSVNSSQHHLDSSGLLLTSNKLNALLNYEREKHNKHCQVMMKELQQIRASYHKDLGHKQDLIYQKSILLIVLSRAQHFDSLCHLISARLQSPIHLRVRGRLLFKCAANAVIAAVRLRRLINKSIPSDGSAQTANLPSGLQHYH
ncbi:hypothetical protein MP228_011344 [Amoeboaphelidium protococcarum]|nr:hypothetical protein MP228_011344 [Amoeboaphelidium protococcarum]